MPRLYAFERAAILLVGDVAHPRFRVVQPSDARLFVTLPGGPTRAPECPRCGTVVDDPNSKFCRACGIVLLAASAPEDPLIDRTLLGRYTVERLIGEGGMGRVYLGVQRIGAASRKVAIKVLSQHVSLDPVMIERFRREAATILQLTHPSTVRLFDFGEDDGRLMLVMEYVSGERLAEVLKRGPLPFAAAVSIALQIAGSLDEAHRLGVIHRDLKPENVILTGPETGAQLVKVVDFGVAKNVDRDVGNPAITARGVLVGTPAYMSPEQFAGIQLDGRSDLYALGLLTYRMLAGELPWSARNVYEWASKHVREPVPPLEEKARGLPPRAYAAVHKALSKLPSERQASAGEFARELSGLAPGVDAWAAIATGEVLRSDNRTPAVNTPVDPVGMATLESRKPRPPHSQWVVLGVVFLLAALLSFVIVGIATRSPRTILGVSRPARAIDASVLGGASHAPDARAMSDAAVAANVRAVEHPNWPRAERALLDGLARARRHDLNGALDALETAQDLIGVTSVKLVMVRDETARLGAVRVRESLARHRCAEAQETARRLRRVGAEQTSFSLFGERCPPP